MSVKAGAKILPVPVSIPAASNSLDIWECQSSCYRQRRPCVLTVAAPLSTAIARNPAVWCLAVILVLVAGGLGAWIGDRHARSDADLQVKAQVRQISTWLDVDEQARAILMSRKAELAFGFARDPSLGNRKVYTLTIKGVPILRAGKTKEGAGVIAFDSSRS